jgi:hypothetical protein
VKSPVLRDLLSCSQPRRYSDKVRRALDALILPNVQSGLKCSKTAAEVASDA